MNICFSPVNFCKGVRLYIVIIAICIIYKTHAHSVYNSNSVKGWKVDGAIEE